MLLFKAAFHQGLKNGSITVTFRLWKTARVKAKSMQRCHPIGVLAIDDVRVVRFGAISDADAVLAGFADRAALVETLTAISTEELTHRTEIYRVELHYAGDGDRAHHADEADINSAEMAKIVEKLDGMDARSGGAPWTRATLTIIAKNPRVKAGVLALELRRERLAFKKDVVKLKRLGLTESFSEGYALTPRGESVVSRLPKRARRKKR